MTVRTDEVRCKSVEVVTPRRRNRFYLYRRAIELLTVSHYHRSSIWHYLTDIRSRTNDSGYSSHGSKLMANGLTAVSTCWDKVLTRPVSTCPPCFTFGKIVPYGFDEGKCLSRAIAIRLYDLIVVRRAFPIWIINDFLPRITVSVLSYR